MLEAVSADQLDNPTPCANWNVRELINHIVGGLHFFEAGARGEAPVAGESDFAAGDFVAAYDDTAPNCIAAFQADGVMENVLHLPFGDMPGSAFIGLASIDNFAHGWDLAKATRQSTDLAPELASQLLVGAQQSISPDRWACQVAWSGKFVCRSEASRLITGPASERPRM